MLCCGEYSRWLNGISPINPSKCNNDVTVIFFPVLNIVSIRVCVCVCAERRLVVFIVSLVFGILLLLVLVIGSLIYCVRKRRPAKRYRKVLSVRSLVHVHQAISTKHIYLSLIFVPVCISCIDAFDLPQDNSTQCFGQAVSEAARILGPHTLASLRL